MTALKRLGGPIATLIASATLALACGSGSQAVEGGYERFEAGVTAADLGVCSEEEQPGGLANQAVDSRVYALAADCSAGPWSEIVVDRFAATSDRDTAAEQFRIASRPLGSGAVWTLDDVLVFAHGKTDGEVMRRLATAMEEAGAT